MVGEAVHARRTGKHGKSLYLHPNFVVNLKLFKNIKSIVKITLKSTQPKTTWNQAAPQEYGFYANVNPAVDHPRWSQASERVIGSGGLLSIIFWN